MGSGHCPRTQKIFKRALDLIQKEKEKEMAWQIKLETFHNLEYVRLGLSGLKLDILG